MKMSKRTAKLNWQQHEIPIIVSFRCPNTYVHSMSYAQSTHRIHWSNFAFNFQPYKFFCHFVLAIFPGRLVCCYCALFSFFSSLHSLLVILPGFDSFQLQVKWYYRQLKWPQFQNMIVFVHCTEKTGHCRLINCSSTYLTKIDLNMK